MFLQVSNRLILVRLPHILVWESTLSNVLVKVHQELVACNLLHSSEVCIHLRNFVGCGCVIHVSMCLSISVSVGVDEWKGENNLGREGERNRAI